MTFVSAHIKTRPRLFGIHFVHTNTVSLIIYETASAVQIFL